MSGAERTVSVSTGKLVLCNGWGRTRSMFIVYESLRATPPSKRTASVTVFVHSSKGTHAIA